MHSQQQSGFSKQTPVDGNSVDEKILIVDDDKVSASLYQHWLADKQYIVRIAPDGKAGLEKAQTFKPDLIIADNIMPGMSGYEMTQQIRKMELAATAKQVPIIIISGFDSMKYLFDYASIFAYMCKPVNKEEFLSAVQSSLNFSKIASNVSPRPKATSQGTKVLIAGGEEFILQKLSSLFESDGASVKLAYDEVETVSLARNWRPNVIFIQFLEEARNLDTPKILKELKKDPVTLSIRATVFCPSHASIDAMQAMPTQTIISYQESSDLFRKLQAYL